MKKELFAEILSDEVLRYCEEAITKISQIRKDSNRPLVPAELFEMAEWLHSFRSWITWALLETEAKYRDKVELFRSEDRSVAASESMGKTTPEYRAYKYLVRVDSLAEEQVLLVKKFITQLDSEFKHSGF